MNHYPVFEGTGSEEIKVEAVLGYVGIETMDVGGGITTIWLSPDEARELARDLIQLAEEVEA